MRKALTALTIALAVIASAFVPASAQVVVPEVIVRPGDTLQWVVGPGSPPHKVRFGANGASPVVEINAILEMITPPLSPSGDGTLTAGTLLTAKVKDSAPVGKTFTFTCGFHPDQMLSFPFIVAAKIPGQTARTHKIVGETGFHWHVHVDTTP